ncbi:hypothetical protein AVEN_152247-1 [Araneus ventricosus]|uniref:Uncharacterized protein n=1 Tax=Araneus ventricosus TaxID=182803 RepID=A0A4Y2KCE3_ARAVE|nr:hypothetical protein AVEN_152247-1 [Araneus ventricosus]
MGNNWHTRTTIRRLAAGFNYCRSHIFKTRRRDLLSSPTWKNAQLFQISVSSCVGHMETLDLFISASYDGILLQLQRSSAGSGTTISPVVLFLAMSA